MMVHVLTPDPLIFLDLHRQSNNSQTMTTEQYEPIGESNYYRSKSRVVAAALLIVAVAAVVALVAMGRSHSNEKATMQELVTTATIELESSSHITVRDCTLTECYASNCNHEVAPFTCLFHNGGPHGGWCVLSSVCLQLKPF